MSTYVIEEFNSLYGKPTVLEQHEAAGYPRHSHPRGAPYLTRAEARAICRRYIKAGPNKTVRERWVP